MVLFFYSAYEPGILKSGVKVFNIRTFIRKFMKPFFYWKYDVWKRKYTSLLYLYFQLELTCVLIYLTLHNCYTFYHFCKALCQLSDIIFFSSSVRFFLCIVNSRVELAYWFLWIMPDEILKHIFFAVVMPAPWLW